MATTTLFPTKPSGSADYFGGAGNDYVLGSSIGDVIAGGVVTIAYATDGSDTLEGGLGDDWYMVNDLTDVITEYAGEGNDTAFTSVNYTLPAEVENIVADGTSAVLLTGNAKDNVLDGSQQTTGNDTLVGALGNDTYKIGSTDKISDTGGIDTIFLPAAITTFDISTTGALTNFTDTTSRNGIENVIAGAGGSITGNDLNNRLVGFNAASDTLIGGKGNDILDTGTGTTSENVNGGDGNDIYIIRSSGTITLTDSLGTDTVKSSVTYDGSGNTFIENITLMGTTAGLTATGNSLANTLTGNSVASTLIGGPGNDLYNVTATGTTVTEVSGGGADTVNFNGAADADLLTLGDYIEKVNLTGTKATKVTVNNTSATNVLLTGNAVNNAITAGAGSDTLIGGAGVNSLAGGAGNDLYIVTSATDVVTEALNAGIDTIQFGGTAGTTLNLVSNNIEYVTLTGSSAINFTAAVTGSVTTTNMTITGNSAANTLISGNGTPTSTVAGGNQINSNVLFGLGGDDNLTGGTSNDTLNGGTGADTMSGGNGNDYYVVDSSSDSIPSANETGGTDTVESSINVDLTATAFGSNTVDNIVLTGTATIATGSATANKITGNSSNNSITGAAGNDTIDAGAGNDVIIGGAGNDSLTGGTGVDTFTMVTAVDNGIDRITDFTKGLSGDVFSISAGAKSGAVTLTFVNGSGAAISPTSPATIAGVVAQVGTATTLTTENVIVLTGATFSNSGLVETAIEVGGSRALTFGGTVAASKDFVVVWSDGLIGHISSVDLTLGTSSSTIAANDATVTDLVTLTGVSSIAAGAFVNANFVFIA